MEQAFEAGGYGAGGYVGGHFGAAAVAQKLAHVCRADLTGGFFGGAAADFVFPFALFFSAHGKCDGTPFVAALQFGYALVLHIGFDDVGTDVGCGHAATVAAAKAAEEARAATAAPAPAAEASAPAAAAKPASAKPEVDTTLRGRTEKMSRLRQVIADRMIDSLQTSAQLTTVVEVDVTRVAALRARAKNDFLAKNGTKLTFLPFFVQAATEALKAHPKINASIEGKNVTYHDVEHVGIAVDTPRGLLVPVVKNAGDLNIPGLAKRINDLAARTRDNKVNPDELSGSTFTITNTGSGGALFDTPIINQPEVAILGLGAIQRQPRVIKDADGGEVIAIRSVCYLALSYDHRLVDGADAARYLMTVKKRLEEGDFGGELGL